MKVFISWSGEKSRNMAIELSKWLKCVLQSCKPWVSTEMDRGTIWFNEITNSLQDAEMGIICLTKSNLNKPWILFEAGAILNSLKNQRVCTLLIDLTPADISDPLAQFNHTMVEKAGFYNLIRTLNSKLPTPLEPAILEEVFNVYWPSFEEQIKEIKSIDEGKNEAIHEREDKDILSEILYSTRRLEKRVEKIEYSDSVKADNYKKSDWVLNTTPIISSKPQNYKISFGNRLNEQRNSLGFSEELEGTTHSEIDRLISTLSDEEIKALEGYIITENK